MPVNYKRELEDAAKTMILVHKPETLIRLIVRTIVQKVNVTHAGILLHEKKHDSYILTVSRGKTGIKIPAGYARMDIDNSLIRFFKERLGKKITNDSALTYSLAQSLVRKKINPGIKNILKKLITQMDIFDITACIPAYFRDELLGILLLGKKKGNRVFNREELDFFIALASDVAMAIRNARLFSDLAAELEKRKQLFIHTTIALAAAIDAKDHYTHGHTARVTSLSLEIAKKLGEKNKKAADPEFLENLHIASLLHDIGKIGIPEVILNKKGPLTVGERNKIQEHTAMGALILKPIKELGEAILGVKYHHEHYDGSGYPDGLKGEEIPLVASVIAVADSYDAMTSDRPYRQALSKEEALREIKTYSGKQFNPEVAAAFVELCKEGKT